ncbi:phosphomannomutase/phosphoglucomutase [Candidatus Woesearchaeota archaeon]|nr:phosphomannomutase/phosphoglucomutase [Candidatus Woesearchaeota archaeon]
MGIFKAYDIRGIYPKELDGRKAELIGKAVASFLRAEQLVVCRDMRLSSDALSAALIKGILSTGCDVIDVGRGSTPYCYFCCAHLKAQGSVMVTASHNPGEYNGFKLTQKMAVPISGDSGLQQIEQLCSMKAISPASEGKKGTIIEKSLSKEYQAHVMSFIDVAAASERLGEMTIVVDAGNGMGSIETAEILKQLPCRIIPLFCELDGSFPNHEANPLKEENTRALQEAVKKSKANLGIAFDGDADRVFFIDELGNRVPSDFITCLIAAVLLKKHPGEKVLYDLRSSWIVPEMITAHSGIPVMTKVGHAFIKERLRKEQGIFAGELSGHFYFRENFFTDSGIIAALHMLGLLCSEGKPLSKLVAPLKKYFCTGEINLAAGNKEELMEKLRRDYSSGRMTSIDGIRIDFPDWWFNARASNTEPLLRIIVEAKSRAIMEEKRKEILEKIKSVSKSP